jgi:XTP/dITP diphosphohydrolase
MARVQSTLEEVAGTADRQPAHFTCALSLCWPDGEHVEVEGEVHGKLTFPARGDKGFGYDPIFTPANYPVTFGEMNPGEKHSISHRASAFSKLIGECFTKKK